MESEEGFRNRASTISTLYINIFSYIIKALANIRGGGEYGEDWSNAGRKLNLQTCLTDFQVSSNQYD